MSGSALNPLLLVKNTTDYSLGLKLSCNSVKSPNECLKSKSTDEIQTAVEKSLTNFTSSDQNYLADPFRLLNGYFEHEDNHESTHPSLNPTSFGPIIDGLVIPSNPSHLVKELEISSLGNVNNRSRSIRSTVNESNVHTLLVNDSTTYGGFIQVKSKQSSEQQKQPPPRPGPQEIEKPDTVTNMANESTQVSLQIRFSSILPVNQMESPIASFLSSSIPSVSLPALKRGPAIGTHDLLLGVNGLKAIDFFTQNEFQSGHVTDGKASQLLQSLFPTHPVEVSVFLYICVFPT